MESKITLLISLYGLNLIHERQRLLYDNPQHPFTHHTFVIDEVLAQYGNNPGVKQEVIQCLLANGEDILNLNPQKIQGCMASLPKIKQEILQRSVQAVLEPKQTMGITLSEREKKIILCELIGAAYSSGAEKQLLESICQTLDIDSEYIEEFDDVVAKLFKANQELAELINE